MNKTFAVITSLLLAVSAAPAPSGKREASEMDITKFTASSNLNGNGASISYDIAIPGAISTHCSYTDSTSTTTMPSISFVACDDDAIEWEFHQDPAQPGGEGQYRIVITYADGSGSKVAGYHEWNPHDFPQQDSATVYTGASTFIITDLQ
ncbi:hypothetical protein F5Y15DRAFT_209241 [Xylariaceae sp. FL0016]|nr:hypothetical protein F5Y15DRAFT_209241 [Xylariaceae sp. FL0016]